jgi:pyrophosphatase PpaX
VVSSRMPDTLTLYLETTGLLSYFSFLISPPDTAEHKPHPAPVLAALSRFGAPADSAVYVGDASFDVASGNAAGVDTVFVGWGHNDVHTLDTTPTWVIQEPSELCQHLR